ncbi:type II toxin-antitoxin system HipA family toxin [Georgenia sp. Z1344]|uniref:type II toxin-antitoxin system HipA family toxin n=1 Tax=Georgenia sp. Z1344 TaxID=3416706 RepID=UPI003CEA74BE
MGDLSVDLYGTRIGRLTGDRRTFDLVPDPGAVARFGLDSQVLSVAIPLSAVPVRARRAQRQNYFAELLPEGRMLTRLAQQARVPETDVLGLLRAHGRDIAGALQIWDPEQPGEPRTPALEPRDAAEVAQMLREVGGRPLGNAPGRGKTSLAGVQDKIVLARVGGGWAQVLDGWPSTHILKPVPVDAPTTIYDEEYGSRIARALGLASHATWIDDFDGVPALVIERYDRSPDLSEGRLHQEDLNQVLGASGDEKYQRHGGRVSLARIAAALGAAAGRESVDELFRLVVLSVAVGNLDMHAKNVSLLHPPDGSMRLAPAYDVVPQAHQPTDGELALSVAGEYRHAAVTGEHLLDETRSWGVRGAEDLMTATLEAVLDVVAAQEPEARAHPGLATDIAGFATSLLAGRPAGQPGS